MIVIVQQFAYRKIDIEGLLEIDPFVAEDIRGDLIKDFSSEEFQANGIKHELAEVFYTKSHAGVIRALHFQREYIQPKLVRCLAGEVFDVIVDLRKGSNTFGKWQGFYLSDENHKELLIPGYCAHGYLVLKPSIVSYKCSQRFYAEYDDGIIWNDPELGIGWPVEQVKDIIISEKDTNLQSFAEFVKKYGGL